ncbi:DsbA family oxidoreductase [Sphingobacterium paludis]|uniref:Putative DsbA family dithiol-disulfide isomerase n=1 Tax=Sphingobacterium paludis TaxID=1476465 RepID=A0A4R7D076_9SPHI|nr:DsbA family oxidoreductase [Sphingobacterium paludis]TDS12874.1 putative DsbA family dithiol-disulfide isomerase [Sphingobacterium paludis]
MAEMMKVEVWSDIMCPFCYIGKRRFEQALAELPFRNQIELEWKSYQLNPYLKTDSNQNYYDNLATSKGISPDEARAMCDQVVGFAKSVQLDFVLDHAVVANSFRAHEFSHFAKRYGKQDQAEELLFQAHFTKGENIDDIGVLTGIAVALGLDPHALQHALENHVFEDEVRQDVYEAQQIGVRGVPFFVYDRKYGISGAQEVDVFIQTATKAFDEWAGDKNPALDVVDGPSCGPEGCS